MAKDLNQIIQEKINLNLMVDEFLDIMIERFLKSIAEHGVGTSKNATGKLVKSFKKALLYNGGDVQKASISFLMYGRFPEMAVGRGMQKGSKVSLGHELYSKKRNDKGQLHSHSRVSKPWYSKTKASQLKRFREILSREYNKHLVLEIENQLKASITLNNIL